MAALRWQPEGGREAVEAALAEAGSISAACARLGIADKTLRRYCAEQGIDLSPAKTRPGRSVVPEPQEHVEKDSATERVASERDHYKRLYREASKHIRTQDDICGAVAARFAEPRPKPIIRPVRTKSTKLPEREAVLLLSDWQLGELVGIEETGGVNAYSWEIATERAGRLVTAVVGNMLNQMQAYRVSRLVVAVLGDIVEGHDIFNGQAWSLERDAAVQSLDGSELMAGVICGIVEELAPRGVTVDVYCVPGNHGKPGGRKAGATPMTFSFDYLLYRMLEKELAKQPIREVGIEPAGRLLFEAAGQVFLMTHGNEVRGWGGFPFYGLDKTHAKLTMELETLFTFWLLGHWHSEATLPAGRGKRVVNGTMVGANQLTQAAVLTTSTPCQKLLYISRDFGLAEEAYMVLAPNERRRPHIYGRSA